MTVDRKQHKYAPLIEELEREGCNVRPTAVHVITVGVRATVPIRNVEVLKSLGIIKEKPTQQKVQASMALLLLIIKHAYVGIPLIVLHI